MLDVLRGSLWTVSSGERTMGAGEGMPLPDARLEEAARGLERLRPVLRRSAAAILRQPEDIEDAVQEALLRLVRHARRFDPQRGSLLGLGRTVVRRVALDMYAKLRPAARTVEPDPPASEAPAALEAAEACGRLREAVERLPDPQRVAFLLVHQEGLSHEEGAKELAISVESLRARLYRARCQLRVWLKELAP